MDDRNEASRLHFLKHLFSYTTISTFCFVVLGVLTKGARYSFLGLPALLVSPEREHISSIVANRYKAKNEEVFLAKDHPADSARRDT